MATSDQPALIVQGGPGGDETITLGRTTTMGRQPNNVVVVAEAGVSRQHAEIVKTDEGYVLRDLNSTNGTFVNQRKIPGDYLLRDGDRVRLGAGEKSYLFRSRATVAEPASAAPAPTGREPVAATPSRPTLIQPTIVEPAPGASETGIQQPVRASPATGVVTLPPEPISAEVPLPAQPSAGGLSGLVERLRGSLTLRRAPKAEPEVPEVAAAATEEPAAGGLTLRSILGTARDLLERARLLVRRRTFTVSVENGVVRVVVVEGREVVGWGIADPQEIDPDDDSPPEQRDVRDSARTQALLDELRLGTGVRLVTELPLYVPLMRQLSLPNIGRRYLESVVMSEAVRSIPFSESEVDIKWRLVQSKPEQKVVAIAVQKTVIDDHVATLQDAGVRPPSATYSQAAALALAAGVPDAIVLHQGPTQSALVLVRDGTPQAVHQVPKSEDSQDSEALAEVLARAVQQIIGFDQSLVEGAGAPRLPLVVTGNVDNDSPLIAELEQMLRREVRPMSPNLEWPEDFRASEYSTNLGLALLDRARPRPWRPDLRMGGASLSLVSARHLPRPLPLKPIGVFVVLALFAISAFNMAPRVDARTTEAADASDLLERKERQERIYRISLKRAETLGSDARAIRRETLSFEDRLAELQDEMDVLGEWFNRIETITLISRPPNVSVSGLTPKADKFTLTGTAASLEDAIRYADNIRASGLFTDVNVREVQSSKGIAPGSASSPDELRRLAGQADGEGGGAQGSAGPELTQDLKFIIEARAVPQDEPAGDGEPAE